MKKSFLTTAVFLMMMSLASCGQGSAADSANEAEAVTAETAAAYDEAASVAQSTGGSIAESGFGTAPSANRIAEADKESMEEAEYMSGTETGSR